MKYPCTGVILAGGMNTRFSGNAKGLLRIGEKRIIDYIYGMFTELFDEIILVTNEPLLYLDWNALIAIDLFPIRSSLTGIHTGLYYASQPHAFFAACDTPFLNKQVVETILNKIDAKADAFIPQLSVGLEPLCAAYARKSLPRIERHLSRKLLKIQRVFKKERIKIIPEKLLRKKDPDLISFFNINTPADLDTAQKLYLKYHSKC